MVEKNYPRFGDEYAQARYPERVTNKDLVKRGKVFELVLGHEGKCVYTPNFIVVTGVDPEAGDLRSQIKGFFFHSIHGEYMSDSLSGFNFSDLGIGTKNDESSSYLLETHFPDVPEESLQIVEVEIIEVAELRKKYQSRKSELLSEFRASYINRVPKVV